jgi:hypothetical protein
VQPYTCVGEGGGAAHSSAAVGSCARHPDSATNCTYWHPTTFGAQATERNIKEIAVTTGFIAIERASVLAVEEDNSGWCQHQHPSCTRGSRSFWHA